jgi:hypothetical protein
VQWGRGGRRSRALTGTDGWLERLMTRACPIAHNLWIVDGPAVRWFTMPFPTRMTIARLADGGLFVHSPIELTAEVREAVAALGVPRYLVSPNKIHHLFWAEWQDA